jgi:hypothetical protein
MDQARARALLADERARLQRLLQAATGEPPAADTGSWHRCSERTPHHRGDRVTEPHDWPFEQPAEGTLRPWYLTATGYLMALFSHPEEAQRARSGLLQHQVSQEDIRLYESQEILRILARAQAQRSILAKAVFALAADSSARQGVLDNAHTGGAALWLVAPTRDRANHLVTLLAATATRPCATTARTAWPTSSRMPTDTISSPLIHGSDPRSPGWNWTAPSA